MSKLVCKKCGSDNIFVQQVMTGSTSTVKTKRKLPFTYRMFYFLTIGWAVALFKLWKRSLVGHKPKSDKVITKNNYVTMCTCQSCGNSWNK